MTVPLDLGICNWIGMTFSLVGKEKLDEMEAGESVLASVPYKHGLAFAATVGMGIAGIVSSGTSNKCAEGDLAFFTVIQRYIDGILKIVPEAQLL